MTLREKALEVAIGEIGNQEIPKGSNDGPHVTKYLSTVGLKPPQFWCMAFVMWCFFQAAEKMGIVLKILRTGSVMGFYNWVKKNHPDWIVSSPMAGDIGIMDFGGGHGHTFLVRNAVLYKVDTIEGNSNDEGSRNGYEVAYRHGDLARKTASILAFIRIPY